MELLRGIARALCPWDSPGKNTGVGCHFLLHMVVHNKHFLMRVCEITALEDEVSS